MSHACVFVSATSTSFAVSSTNRGNRRREKNCRGRGVVTAFALFGLSSKKEERSGEKFSLAAIEAEIDAAPSSTSAAAATQLSLADAVWKISKDIPLSLRDRVVCTIAAEAVQALCETGLDGASLVRKKWGGGGGRIERSVGELFWPGE